MNGFFYSLNQELTLRQSKVRVSVASLGVIKTDAVRKAQEMGILDHIPESAVGSLEECSMIMVEGLIEIPDSWQPFDVQSDSDLETPSGERLLSTKSGSNKENFLYLIGEKKSCP
eukprot:sb/3476795/